ncbi:TonB-dependent receptor [Sphingomonas cavernae]|uniref:TonB-dependent receptor n=1 Tax=Sphingomonas cavernae TaxID=2320861 RepID=A0A418W6I6_9SPHN|nr:TonB-dependent receptor [Sphingomonas cavernae]
MLSGFVAISVPAPLLAQAENAPANVDGVPADAIVVTAARTVLPASALPLTVDVIDAESLAQQVSIAGSVVDAVSNLSPSFSPTRQKLSGSGETLRGRSPLYAINGVPQSTPIRDGSRDGYTIDPFFIDRVELIYGSNALQGIGATGGVVNQVTVGPPSKDGISGRVLLQGTADNDFSDDGLGGKIGGFVSWRGGAFDATVGATYEARGAFYDGDGRRLGVDGTQGEVQDSKSWSVFGRFGWQIGESARLDLIANHFELEGDGDYVVVAGNRTTGLPTSSVRGTPPGTPPSNTADSVSLTLTDDDLVGGHLVAQVFYNKTNDVFGGPVPRRNDTFQDPTIAPNGTLFDQSANKSRKIGGKISYERAIIEGLTGTIGFDAMVDKTEQALIQTGRAWVPPTEFVTLAPFGQLNLALLDDKVHLAGGVRWENDKLKVDDFHTLASTTLATTGAFGGVAVSGGSRSFQDALLNGGVVIEPIEGVRAYASYAEGYTIADVGRILRGIGQPNVDVDDYIDLEPVVSNNREIGVELKRGPLNASAAYFWSSSKKGSLLVLQNGVFNVLRQRIEIEGLELNLAVQMPIPGLDVSAGYAHLTGRTDSNQDGKVDIDLDGANISPDRFNLAANYRSGPLTARVQGNFYLSRRFDLFANDPMTPAQIANQKENAFDGYTVVDASVRYATRFGGISLSVQNLLNEQYITYNSDTTRAGDNLLYFAGRGRTFTLGWDYRF